MKDDGIGVFEIESKYLINAKKEILIEQNNITQEREISLLLCEMERANLSLVLKFPFKYSSLPIIFNEKKFGGVNYLVSEAMQNIVFKV